MPEYLKYNTDCESLKASYASFSTKSRGRLHNEPGCAPRSEFQRDRDRIIHSTAFRRLEYKTQVFVNHEGDHYRTRLTHSLEVAQLSRSIARELRLDEDLAEAFALAHDLGHPPFGHAGEDALNEAMKPYGGFDHNAQTIRILTTLENRYASFDGMNLTWECLEGIAKHNGPVTGKIPRVLEGYNSEHDLELSTYSGLEAQVAAICDDIAYHNHDIEDGLRARLFTINDMADVPLVGEMFSEVRNIYPDCDEWRLINEVKRRLISQLCADLYKRTIGNIKDAGVQNVDDVRASGQALAGFSEEMLRNNKAIKAFLHENMYRHYKVNRMTSKGKRIIGDLFALFMAEPECLPTMWQSRLLSDDRQKAEVVADFIAGMTDRFALEEHRRLFDLSYKIIGNA